MMHENYYSEYDKINVAEGLDNIGWRFSPHKNVTLVIDEACKKLDGNAIYMMVVTHLCHCEWEEWVARLVDVAIHKAVAEEKKEVDISPLFKCELVAWDICGEYSMTAETVKERLMEFLFEVVAENDKELQVKIKSNS